MTILLLWIALSVQMTAQLSNTNARINRVQQDVQIVKTAIEDKGVAHYRHDGPALLPDAKYSPGQVAITDKAKLCPHANTKERRNVPESEKLAVCLEYGISAKNCNGKKYEIDHIISLELGGDNDIRNLFPQPYLPRPGAHEKDRLENNLHSQVCSGKISISDAQREIAEDWYKLYLKMNGEKQ